MRSHFFCLLSVPLIEAYESEHYPIDESTPLEILQHLMEMSQTRQEDLIGIIGSSVVVSEVINGQRSFNKAQAKALADYFQVSINLFI